MKKNLRSEAAIKRAIKEWKELVPWKREKEPIIELFYPDTGGTVVVEIDLREIVKKRKPLTGIKKQVEEIVRGSKAKPKRRK